MDNTPFSLSEAINDQGGKIEEVCLVLAVLMENLDSSGQGAKETSVLAVAIRDLTARYNALYDIAERVCKLDPARPGKS